jgi:hypothetical protein
MHTAWYLFLLALSLGAFVLAGGVAALMWMLLAGADEPPSLG